jgi:adenosylhomocysteine nucleosidase
MGACQHTRVPPAPLQQPSDAPWGVVCALPEELGRSLGAAPVAGRDLGVEWREAHLGGARVRCAVAGIGKVRAAHAACALLAAGPLRGLLVVGVCGGLRAALVPGTLVHCMRAVQTDRAGRGEREFAPDADLCALWRAAAPGAAGWFLTADRPVLSLWRRLRLARAFLGPCVADMETAAVAAVADRAGVPWAALRAVTDQATGAALASFRMHFASQAGRAADTLPALLQSVAAAPTALPERSGAG